jgi:MYXO-CTERM domain-containing protein
MIRNEQHTLQLWLLVGLGFFGARTALAADYYVATTGSDSNAGTLAQPFATLQKGANVAVAGDTVWIRGGTYSITTPATAGAGINFTKSGTSDTNRIKYWAYTGEIPVFDFTNMVISTTGYTHGFVISGSWLHFKGLEIRYVPMNTFSNNGVAVTAGGNDIFELLNMHHNSGNGIFIGSKSAGGHLILNCDAHDNYDATSTQGQGQNADGFGVHYQTAGATTIVRGCRAWWNSDDGYDLINQEVPVIVENSWAFANGYANYGTYNPTSGNGNGFKMGSSKTGVRHTVQNNVAWRNKANGFYANHSTGGNNWYNNTSFNNGNNYNMLASSFDSSGNVTGTITLTGALAHVMRNNIDYPSTNQNTNMGGVDTAFNTWDLGITPAAKDFLSITDPTVSGTGQALETTSPALGPRQADGSLPNVDFLKLAAGSTMIDKGTNVGLPYNGAAPDLGAYEYGGTAGSTGTGGAGTGGAGTGGAGTGGTVAVGTGGKVSTGGAQSSTGGAGVATTGGRANTGGAVNGIGGALIATGGSPVATGGLANAGGSPSNTGGSGLTSGGKIGTGGVGTTGGAVAAGGATLTAGGNANTGGLAALGGALNVGGSANGTSTEVSQTGGAGSSPDSGSCSCHVAGLPSRSSTTAGVALMGLLLLRPRRRRVQR